MAPRSEARRQRPPTKHRHEQLNLSSAPVTEREWVVFRAGVLEGVERAQADARLRAEQFFFRAHLNGVEFSTPSAAAAVQTSAAPHAQEMRTHVAGVKAFRPQLKRRRSA